MSTWYYKTSAKNSLLEENFENHCSINRPVCFYSIMINKDIQVFIEKLILYY